MPVISLIIISLFTGCSFSEKEQTYSFSGFSIGTSYSVKYVSASNEVETLQLGVDGVLSNINKLMSTYLPGSDISRISRAGVNEPVSVDELTINVLEAALTIAEQTDGNFDPTVAPLVNLWGFGPTPRNNKLPEASEVARLAASVGYQALTVDRITQTVEKNAPRELDFSAIAKGYAVDLIAEHLEQRGITNYLVEVGGEMRLSGTKPGNESWRIAIEKPDVEQRAVFKILEVSGAAVATSGDYRNYFESDGVRYSHTINPATGYPVKHNLASVTVVMDSCMSADAYATAFLVMGAERALQFAESNNIAALFIIKQDDDFEVLQSAQFTEEFGEV
ncbi:FAD:protein FMN transferase [Reinekea marinisedimentorum]|uniref:FAD:protein FMN transferase n=1 Tax=Reinekea marinisedimentorum TaxID=230495 RepID=A0A4R3IAS6_9GAMM|nr:FAD:protein FMN transferase [Reinekea marinisedimentorum]TCS42627.1 thiamine biosynthesis lipoprotein [Reinekea marinisedimentorum]